MNRTKRIVESKLSTHRIHRWRKSLWKSFIFILISFLMSSSLHGLKHIVANDVRDVNTTGTGELKIKILDTSDKFKKWRLILQRTLWIALTVLGTLFSVYLMKLVWNRFQTQPTVTTVETTNYPIWDVPFPAVTVCNVDKIYKPRTLKIYKLLSSHGFSRIDIENFLSNLSATFEFEDVYENHFKIEKFLFDHNYSIENIFMEVLQPCNSILKNCLWLGESVACFKLFRTIKSSNGFCCSFNYKALKPEFDINYDNYLTSIKTIDHVSGAGEFMGIAFNANTGTTGVEVMIHSPEEFPDVLVSSIMVDKKEDARISVVPEVIMGDPNIQSMDPMQRDCWFNDENDLVFSKQYTFESCITECRASYTVRLCGCLPFFYPVHVPRDLANKRVRQCSLKDLSCLKQNRHVFFNFLRNGQHQFEGVSGMKCNCLPTCSTNLYKTTKNVGKLFPNDNLNDTSLSVRVFFGDLSCIKYKRDMVMSWDSLFAAFGGIFGLCLGGSIISLIELVYFFTFKFYMAFHIQILNQLTQTGIIMYQNSSRVNLPRKRKFIHDFNKDLK